jgi:hypothetical protein
LPVMFLNPRHDHLWRGFFIMVSAYHEKGGLFGWISATGAAYSDRH